MTTPSLPHTSLGERGRDHLLGNFTAIRRDSPPLPVYVRGEGCYVFGDDGRRYLDGLSAMYCVNVGHGRVELAEAAAAQAQKLAFFHAWGAAHPPAVELAERVASLAAPGLDRVFFTSGGSESVESALKLARSYHLARGDSQRLKVIARNEAYHGTSLGALAATGIQQLRGDFEPMIVDIGRHVPNTDTYRAPAGSSPLDSARAIEKAILHEGAETVSAVILEPVQNNGGCLVPPDGYFGLAREICDRHGVLLISDEVVCAWGRLGEMFGHLRYGYSPDIVTVAKGLTSAYAPMGAVVASHKVAKPFLDGPSLYAHGFTFSGHPVGAAIAMRNIDIIEDEGLCAHVRQSSPLLRERLDGLRDIPVVGDVRGDGLLFSIELVRDQETKERLGGDLGDLLARHEIPTTMREAGLITRVDNRLGTPIITLAPPLIAGAQQFDEMEAALRIALTRASTLVTRGEGSK